MRLQHLQLSDYKLHGRLALRFADGLTVLQGRNESGKSTVAEAIHRSLFLPARSGGAVVESMRTRPAQADPQVVLTFRANGAQYELTKRFGKQRGSVSLTTGSGGLLQADAAEQALAELVGASSVRGGNATRLKERWGHLWVWQGQSAVDPLELSAEAMDQARLLRQLQSCSQATIQSTLDQQVMAAVRQRWLIAHTETGREGRAGSELDLALKAAAQARALAEQCTARHTSRQAAIDEHDCARGQLSTVDQQLPLLQRLAALQLKQQVCAQDLAALKPQWQQGQQEDQRCLQLQQRLKPALENRDALRARLPELERHWNHCDRQLQAALRQAEDLQHWIRRASLSNQLQQLDRLEAQRLEVEHQLGVLPALDAAAVERLRQLERDEQAAGIALASLVTTLEVLRDGVGLLLDGVPLNASESRRLEQPVALTSADGSIALRITPGGGEGVQAARTKLAACRAALANALERCGVSDLQQAIQAERQRTELLAEQRSIAQQCRPLDRQRIVAQLQGLPEIPDGEVADADAMRSRLDALVPAGRQLRQQLNEADASLRAARSQLERLDLELESDRASLLKADTLLGDLQRRHGGLKQLGERIGSLERELQQLQGQRDELQPQLSQLGLDAAAPPSPEALQQRREHLLQQLAATGARLEVDGQVDLAAQLEEAIAEEEYCNGEVQRLQREARMLDLLHRLFAEQQTALAERYTEPLGQALDRYLKLLDLDHERIGLHFDSRQGFSDLCWQRRGGLAWSFADLSGGTRELLACALRLAIAEVLAPAYDGCLPVLFDDAFTNVDPSRWRGLAAMLQHGVEQGLQVLFLSCDPGLIETLAPERIHQLGSSGDSAPPGP